MADEFLLEPGSQEHVVNKTYKTSESDTLALEESYRLLPGADQPRRLIFQVQFPLLRPIREAILGQLMG